MRVHIASDHAGFDLKTHLVEHLRDEGHDVVDHGAGVYDAQDDYPPICIACGEGVVADPGSLGVVIGGSGNGEQIAANKVRGVRAVVCSEPYTAVLSRQHNDANVLALGARVVGTGLARMIVREWLAAEFEGGRHARRVGLIEELGEPAQSPAF